jgi:hypothetical protein
LSQPSWRGYEKLLAAGILLYICKYRKLKREERIL